MLRTCSDVGLAPSYGQANVDHVGTSTLFAFVLVTTEGWCVGSVRAFPGELLLPGRLPALRHSTQADTLSAPHFFTTACLQVEHDVCSLAYVGQCGTHLASPFLRMLVLLGYTTVALHMVRRRSSLCYLRCTSSLARG